MASAHLAWNGAVTLEFLCSLPGLVYQYLCPVI